MADAIATELQGDGEALLGERREERKRRKRAQNFSGEGKHSENDGVQESSPFFKKQFDSFQRADRTPSTIRDYSVPRARHLARSCAYACRCDVFVMPVLSRAVARNLRGRKTQWYNNARGEDAGQTERPEET